MQFVLKSYFMYAHLCFPKPTQSGYVACFQVFMLQITNALLISLIIGSYRNVTDQRLSFLQDPLRSAPFHPHLISEPNGFARKFPHNWRTSWRTHAFQSLLNCFGNSLSNHIAPGAGHETLNKWNSPNRLELVQLFFPWCPAFKALVNVPGKILIWFVGVCLSKMGKPKSSEDIFSFRQSPTKTVP